ncbi:hypothetical protein TcasGA2_TC004046 [Tribolium castaneum]|uniref:Uncharacterized protein n=1 Tax=Tribolium castaneum TaxID=7070 RepID=D7EIG8_TRICA|nr:hypothetical protein TcasGA2_TC004046 [Tribolium castaneum]
MCYTPEDVITPDEWSDLSLEQSLIQLVDKVEKDESEKLERMIANEKHRLIHETVYPATRSGKMLSKDPSKFNETLFDVIKDRYDDNGVLYEIILKMPVNVKTDVMLELLIIETTITITVCKITNNRKYMFKQKNFSFLFTLYKSYSMIILVLVLNGITRLIAMDLRFKALFTAIVAGPTACGKSYFTTRFLKHLSLMCDVQFHRIVWFYDEWQPLYEINVKAENLQIGYHQGIPDMSNFDSEHPTLIIIDDLMREANGRVVDIFTKGSHYRNLNVFYITQNLFHQGKGQRDISLNANYTVYFKNPRDRAQIKFLARQIYPENTKFIQLAYQDATSRVHGYLLFDLKQNTPEDYRIRLNILPDEGPSYVYIPKKNYKLRNN